MTTAPLPQIAYPGLPLGPSTSYHPGPGTHLHTTNTTTQIIASLAGRPILTPAPKTSSKDSKQTSKPLPTISIPRILPSPSQAAVVGPGVSNKNALPRVGSCVLGVVRRVRTRQVEVGIVVVYGGGDGGIGEGEGVVCADEWAAVLRREDVRATEVEKVRCEEGFRVGDVVRGSVVCFDSFCRWAAFVWWGGDIGKRVGGGYGLMFEETDQSGGPVELLHHHREK